MKRYIILILTVLILSACTSKTYTTSFEAGIEELKLGNYSEAVNQFQNALEDKETDEAKANLQFAETLSESHDLYLDGDFDTALYAVNKALTSKVSKTFDQDIIKPAEELKEEIIEAKNLADSLTEQFVIGKTLLAQEQYEQAYEIFQQISETKDFTNISLIEKMTQEATVLLNETKKLKEKSQQEKEKQEAAKEKEKEEKEEQVSQTLTHEQAESLVRTYLNLNANPSIFVKYDHDADNGDYIIQVYEIVVDDPKTGAGHTATWGWYGVNKTTREIYDAMN
jgi:tetratricopeptide (TPR) repeat protein